MEKTKQQKILLGAHISIAGGLHKAIERATKIECTTIQIFTKNNKTWFGKKLQKEEVDQFKKAVKKSNISHIMAHSSYLINICSANPIVEEKSCSALKHELERCEELKIPYLILHPGSHLGKGEEKGIKKISKNLDKVLSHATGTTLILLETMAGQGTNIGYTFEQLKKIYSGCKYKTLIGICLDTCHIFAAGYDISTSEGYVKTWKKFEKIIGYRRLKAIHINDSQTKLGSKKDRHANIGKGEIPLKTFELLMNDKKLAKVPKVLETPSTDGITEYKKEIKLLRKMIK